MKLKFVVAVFALATPPLAHAQPSVPKPTKADAQKVVQIVTADKSSSVAAAHLIIIDDMIDKLNLLRAKGSALGFSTEGEPGRSDP